MGFTARTLTEAAKSLGLNLARRSFIESPKLTVTGCPFLEELQQEEEVLKV